MSDAKKVSAYFAEVLRRGGLESVEFANDAAFLAVPREELSTGQLGEDFVERLFTNEERSSRSQGKPLSIVISLLTTSTQRGKHQGLLCLAANLERNGTIVPVLDQGISPWIPADRLTTPDGNDLEVMMGPAEEFWTYRHWLSQAEQSQVQSFEDVLGLCEKLCQAVTGVSADEFGQQHPTVISDYCYIQVFERMNTAAPLVSLYDHLNSLDEYPKIMQQVLSGWKEPRQHERTLQENEGLYQPALQSCGSMGDEYPLTDSQRRAVHGFLSSGANDVTAVSGPPGTGKTTMLQSVVANMLTRNALNRADSPVIVATSTNNQAVTNVINSFASVAKDEPGALDLRWLPVAGEHGATDQPMESLAVYCPSKSKLKDALADGYMVEQLRKDYTYASYSDQEYLEAARVHFLAAANRYFAPADDIEKVCNNLHWVLSQIDAQRCRLLELMYREGPTPNYISFCQQLEEDPFLGDAPNIEALKQCTTLRELDQKLDISLRYLQFWLAVHYYEAQWLLTEDFLDSKEQSRTTPRYLDRYWRQAATLTPCFVMTLYQVPKYFSLYSKPGEPQTYDIGRIDLLIVDEAGQVDTPLGVPVLGLAKRAILVGDEQQISPVWNIDELLDEEIAVSVGISEDQWHDELRVSGRTCSSPSSLMRAASFASRWCYGEDQPGLFLSEHFRCHPGIIKFCNDLLYQGLLQPKRPAEASKLAGLTPAFLWKDVPNSQDTPAGSSRQNVSEAKAIAAWIVEHLEHYGKIYEPDVQLADVIGVVTPFSAQARLIQRELGLAVANSSSPFIPKDLARKITIGTAHRLQGAEKPIVLFSTTYGKNSAQAGFIDANPELINVAVSRAKDLFVVFAAPQRWGTGKVFSVMSEFAVRQDRESLPVRQLQQAVEVVQSDTGDLAAADAPMMDVVQEPVPQPEMPLVEDEPIPTLTVTDMIGLWKDAGHLVEEDRDRLKAAALNLRLCKAGLLVGEPGKWKPSVLGSHLGIQHISRTGKNGGEYKSLEYTPEIHDLLLAMYLDGQL